MSSLKFNRQNKAITLHDSAGKQTGSWRAENNVVSEAKPWPNGSYKFSWHSRHADGNADSAFGSHGNFIFEVVGREGLGVHSGRTSKADGHGNTGPAHVTNGCIRTTEAGCKAIADAHAKQPLTTIDVA